MNFFPTAGWQEYFQLWCWRLPKINPRSNSIEFREEVAGKNLQCLWSRALHTSYSNAVPAEGLECPSVWKKSGTHGADVPGAAIPSPWDFLLTLFTHLVGSHCFPVVKEWAGAKEPGNRTHQLPTEWAMHGSQTGKNTRYAEYVRHSSMIAPRISGCVLHNMACAELGTSASRNSRRTRESRRT